MIPTHEGGESEIIIRNKTVQQVLIEKFFEDHLSEIEEIEYKNMEP